MSSEPTAHEINRRAAAVNDLHRQIGLSTGAETEWWNRRTYGQLGGLTPTQAWLRGDHKTVEQLIADWYAATEHAAERHRGNPDFMATLRKQSAAIAEQAKRSA